MPDVSDFLVGQSEVFRAFATELRQVARSAATVLVEGDSGAGKGAAARAIHALSLRSAGPCVEINLASLAPTLIESELFGHEKGAFTDAREARRGCFRRAEGGTLCLDDVDLLPKMSQVKLLRALQERVVEPLGSEESVPVDVRVVATTNADLRALVESGEFRQDLYYRLAVVPLRVPPLRARLEDLPLLAEHLLAAAARRVGAEARPLSEGALERLAAHSWPGNVRELENALERVVVLAAGRSGAPVEAEELDFLAETTSGAADEVARSALANGLQVADVERAMLHRALEECRGNVSAAARRVGLTRRAFEYRLEREGDRTEDAEEAGE
jgi:DNA-binding NtrC family response regulator